MRIVIVLLLLSAVPFCNASEGYSCERQNGIKLTDLNLNSFRALLDNPTFRNEIIGQFYGYASDDLIAEEQHGREHVIQQMEQNQWNSITIKNKRGLEALLQEERSVIEGEDSDQVAIAQSQKRAERRKKREDEKFEKERATVISEESTDREAIVKAERTGAATIVKNFKSISKSIIRRTAKNAQARKHAETSSVPLDPSTSTMGLPLQDTQVETKEKPYEETSSVPLDLSTSTMDLPLQDTQVETKEKPGVLIYRHNPYADPSTIYMWCSK